MTKSVLPNSIDQNINLIINGMVQYNFFTWMANDDVEGTP